MRFNFLIIFLFLISACASLGPASGPAFKPTNINEANNAVLYVYRPDVEFNRAGSPEIFLNGEKKALLRAGGFKIVLHWMPNLLGATLDSDREDFLRLWDGIAPDEIKIYPTQLLENTELHAHWKAGPGVLGNSSTRAARPTRQIT